MMAALDQRHCHVFPAQQTITIVPFNNSTAKTFHCIGIPNGRLRENALFVTSLKASSKEPGGKKLVMKALPTIVLSMATWKI